MMNPGVNFIYGQYGGHHEANHVQLRHYNNVILDHCTVSGEPSTIDGQYALLGTDVDGLIVRDCTFRDYRHSIYSGNTTTESKNWTFTNTNFVTTSNSGECQDSCRTSCDYATASSCSLGWLARLSGLSVTVSTWLQSRVAPVQRSGCRRLAAS